MDIIPLGMRSRWENQDQDTALVLSLAPEVLRAVVESSGRDPRRLEIRNRFLVGPQSPFFERVGGLHHIYANEKAIEGYTSGKFPNGSVLIFDVFETRETAGTTIEGPRRFIDVMEKDSKRFTATGGWGFEEFKGDSQTERVLTAKAAQECHACHAAAKDHDSVFSRFRK